MTLKTATNQSSEDQKAVFSEGAVDNIVQKNVRIGAVPAVNEHAFEHVKSIATFLRDGSCGS
jgi:hypothetical protein